MAGTPTDVKENCRHQPSKGIGPAATNRGKMAITMVNTKTLALISAYFLNCLPSTRSRGQVSIVEIGVYW